jgi:hypothetical protein
MDPTAYKYTAMAFWMEHIDADDDEFLDGDIDAMAEALDGTAQDMAMFYLNHGESPWLCFEEDLRQLECLRSACEALLLYWKNGTAVDGGSEVADRVRAALAIRSTAERSE